MPKGLSEKQLKFIAVYAGNAVEACRLAGYKGNVNVLAVAGHELLRNPKVKKAIESRQTKQIDKLIATREDRQKFWTEIMKSDREEMNNRLKASELLGRSEADFTEKLDAMVRTPEPVTYVPAVRKNAPGRGQ